MKSKCCNAEVTVRSGDNADDKLGGTMFFVCGKCGEACGGMKQHLCWVVSNEISDNDRWRLKKTWRLRMNLPCSEPSIEDMARELAIERGILKEGERF